MVRKRLETTSETVTGYQFDDITLDTARRSVIRRGQNIRLGKLTYELLLLLIQSAPGIVTQEEVAARLWKNRVVTPDTIRQRVKLLRKALDDDAEEPRYLSVVRGQGYGIIPKVESITTTPQSRTTPHRWFLAAAVTLAIGVSISMIYMSGVKTVVETDGANGNVQLVRRQNSIAVLPFENLASHPDDTYFVDGIHNDLLTQLAKISSLKIISRTSVLEYQDKKKNLRKIGDELNVSTILEGSVQRSGESVRINVQLIDAESDEHIWAERYDRKLTAQNLFAIQTEITTAVAGALQAIMSPDEIARLKKAPTDNTAAYNHYLIGNHRTRRTINEQTPPGAGAAYQLAVDEDPGFALAWAALSRSQSALYSFVDRTEESLEIARQSAERAFELEPDLPEAHLAMAYYYYRGSRDYERALQELALAEQGMPGDQLVYTARSQISSEMGDLQESIVNLEKVIELDPRNVQQLLLLGFSYARLHDYQQAEHLFDRVIEIDPDNPAGYQFKANAILWQDGVSAPAQMSLASAPIEFQSPEINWRLALYERDFEAALGYLDDWAAEAVDLQRRYMPKAWFYGVTHELARTPELAEQYFDTAREIIDGKMKNTRGDSRVLIALADVLAHQGEHESAVAYAHRALESVATTRGKIYAGNVQLNAIMTFVAAEEFDLAVETLDDYLAKPEFWSIEGLLPDPRFDAIRDEPAFTAVVEKYRRR